VEGILRDAVRIRSDDGTTGYDSLVVLSMLRGEFAARRAQALELP
jgi:hypothetical protein